MFKFSLSDAYNASRLNNYQKTSNSKFKYFSFCRKGILRKEADNNNTEFLRLQEKMDALEHKEYRFPTF